MRHPLPRRLTFALASFMHRVGAIRNQPKSWQDYFFQDPVTAQGT